ncbi:Uncharacterized conserved protein [Ceraceosorus bombacis]|uniref:Uncharacterized conserved protein n=1 Tax=Ceraceosorus bombacis TaxID=401625 RepID=A0A0P1BE12_9BASI|nr:Uncharacterized conserved protein [Ceraceosorus bombacis]
MERGEHKKGSRLEQGPPVSIKSFQLESVQLNGDKRAHGGSASSRAAACRLQRLPLQCVRKALGDQSAAEDERWATISQSAVRSADSLRPAHILHLGLGSVKDNRIAQFQLGFLLLLRDQLGGEACSVQGFDPIWTKEDTDLLGSFGLTCLSKNEQGSYVLEQPTLVYMPHCGRSLYESILRANWSIKGLQNLLLCSNGFDKYAQLSNDLKRKAPCMHRILPHLHVMPLPSIPAPNHDSLNDLVFQRFAPTLQAAERQSREGSANASSVDGLAAHMRHTLSLDPPITPWKPGFWELPPLDPQQLGKDPELQ